MLRLTIQTQEPGETVVEAHGELAAEDLPLLVGEVERFIGDPARLVLDLNGVSFIDRESAELLGRWVARGLVLRGGSLFVREFLRSCGLESGPS